MNIKEEQALNRVLKVIGDLQSENAIYRNDLTEMVLQINKKVDAKHTPVQLETDILKASQLAIGDAIKSALGSYGSPLQKLVLEVVNNHSTEVKGLINEAFTTVIRTDEFKQSVVNAFSHKVARTIISNNDGLFDKVANELKQDAVFKSKMAIAVSNVVEECLNERKLTN